VVSSEVKITISQYIRLIQTVYIVLCIVLKFSLLIVSDGKKCSFSLREDTECWYLLLREMWSGRVMSDEQNDPLIRDLAVENALIVDAFLCRFHNTYRNIS